MTERSRIRVRLVPSATGDDRSHYATSFLINDTVALDAGALGYWRKPEQQARVRHVFLSHTHADHVASLPILLENAWDARRPPIEVWGGAEVLESLRADCFNGRVWPSLEELAAGAERPFAVLRELAPERPVEVESVRVTPVPVHHTVPTFGFLVESGGCSVLFSGDTGPTARLWDVGRARGDLVAVFLEASFPDEEAELARVSGHLTPRGFAGELDKLGRDVPAIAVHVKARWRAATARQLEALGPRVAVGVPGREYAW